MRGDVEGQGQNIIYLTKVRRRRVFVPAQFENTKFQVLVEVISESLVFMTRLLGPGHILLWFSVENLPRAVPSSVLFSRLLHRVPKWSLMIAGGLAPRSRRFPFLRITWTNLQRFTNRWETHKWKREADVWHLCFLFLSTTATKLCNSLYHTKCTFLCVWWWPLNYDDGEFSLVLIRIQFSILWILRQSSLDALAPVAGSWQCRSALWASKAGETSSVYCWES